MRRVLVAMLLLCIPIAAFAQAETTGRLTGSVVDEEGNGVAGAAITATSPGLQGERTTTTDENGRFVLGLLPPGNYAISIEARGWAMAEYSMRLGIGENHPLDVTMKKGEGVTESVTVWGNLSHMQTTTGGENFNYPKQVDDLPIVERQIERVAELAPNISFGPTPDTISIAGAPSFDTVVMLDGAEISDPYFGTAPIVYLEEAIEEVQVLTTGISARYGRFQGGVINATTKSGGNTYEGGVRLDFSKESWNSTTPFNESQSDVLTKAYSGTFSGPIVKDRLTFFVGGRTIPTESLDRTTALSGQSFTRERDEDRYQIKLTGSATANHVFEASYLNFESSTTGRDGLPAGDVLALGKRDDPRDITTLEYQGILNDSTFINVQGTAKRVSIKSGGDPAKGSPFLDFYQLPASYQVWHNHWWDFEDTNVRDNDTVSVGLTHVLSTSNWGDHTLEYGVSYVNSMTAGENRQSSTGFNLLNYDSILTGDEFTNVAFINGPIPGDPVFDPNNPLFNLISYADGGLTYRWVALPLGGGQELENTALYVQDTWSRGKWRVDAGLRWESYEGTGPEPTLDLDFDEIAPRLGVTYNMDQNWQLQATWGKYVSRFNDSVAGSISGVSGAPYVVQIYTGPTTCPIDAGTGFYTHCQTYAQLETALMTDANWGITTTVTDPKQPTRFLGSNTSAPYATELNLAVKRALPGNTGTFSLRYTDRRYRDLLDDFVGDQGAPVSVTDPLGSGAVFVLDRTTWTNASEARRDYESITAQFDYRPGNRWNIGGNWTYATTQGNYEGEGRNQPSSGSVIGDYPRSINQAAAVPYGFLDDDIRHRVRVYGSYTFDFERAGNLTLGAVGLYQSGLPYSLSGSQLLLNDPTYLNEVGQRYTYFTDGRGNNRFGGFWAIDLSGRYQIILAKDISAYIKLDILNVTDNDELTAFSTSGSVAANAAGTLEFVPGSSFGQARSDLDYQEPRSFFVSAGIQF